MNGAQRRVLVDTGCSTCIAHASCCQVWKKEPVDIITISGDAVRCIGNSRVRLQVKDGRVVDVEAFVVQAKPLGFEFILGMNGIAALGGVTVNACREVRFLPEGAAMVAAAQRKIVIDEKDFTASYCPVARVWTAEWKWTHGEKQSGCADPSTSLLAASSRSDSLRGGASRCPREVDRRRPPRRRPPRSEPHALLCSAGGPDYYTAAGADRCEGVRGMQVSRPRPSAVGTRYRRGGGDVATSRNGCHSCWRTHVPYVSGLRSVAIRGVATA